MKSVTLIVMLLIATYALGQTSFCLTVNDVCCDNEYSSNTHQLQSNDSFNWYYIDYDATGVHNQVIIRCDLDGIKIWQKTYCGCGRDSVYYPTAQEYLIRVEVSCEICPQELKDCVSGTSVVKVYSPRDNDCRFDCE